MRSLEQANEAKITKLKKKNQKALDELQSKLLIQDVAAQIGKAPPPDTKRWMQDLQIKKVSQQSTQQVSASNDRLRVSRDHLCLCIKGTSASRDQLCVSSPLQTSTSNLNYGSIQP